LSTRQLMRQLEYKARALTWANAPSETVFSSDGCLSSALTWDQLIDHIRFPACIFNVLSSSPNAEAPGLKILQIKATIIARHDNDRQGRLVLQGGHQAYTTGSSKGKGLLELQEKLWDAIASLGRDSGVVYQINMTGERMFGGSGVDDAIALAVLEIDFEAIVFEKSIYPDTYKIATSQVSADVVITWVDPPDRYDRISSGGIIVARKSGSNPTTAEQIATVAIGTQTYTDLVPAAASYTYGLFASYDETNPTPTTATNYSDGIFSTITVT